MKKDEFPNIGEKIELEKLDTSTTASKKQLFSQVLDIIDDYFMFIATPISHNILVPISIGQIIKIRYIKKNIGVYGFKAKVLSRKKVSNLSYLKIERISDIFREQRRNFFRLKTILKLEIKVIGSGYEEEKIIYGFTKDISGGGLRFIVKEPLKLHSKVKVIIHMEDESITTQGRVIRCSNAEGKENTYEVGLMFENIDEKTRTKIISFIFEYQRKMREKGLV